MTQETRFDPKQVAFGNLKNAALKGVRKNQQRLEFDVFTPTENASFEEGMDDSLLVGNSASSSKSSNNIPVSSIIDDIKNKRSVSASTLNRLPVGIRNSLSNLGESRSSLSSVISAVSAKKKVSNEEALYFLINEDSQALEAAYKTFGDNVRLSVESVNKLIKVLRAAANRIRNQAATNQLFRDLTVEEAKKIFALLDEDVPESSIQSRLTGLNINNHAIGLAATSQANDELLNTATLAVSNFGIGGVLSKTIKESSNPQDMIEVMFKKAVETSNPTLLKETREEAIKYEVPLKLIAHEQIGASFKYQSSWHVYEFIKNYIHRPELYLAIKREPLEYLDEVFSSFAYKDYIDIKQIENRTFSLASLGIEAYLGQPVSNQKITLKHLCSNIIRSEPLDQDKFKEDNPANENRNLFYSVYLDICFKRFNYQEFNLSKWFTALDTILSTFDQNWANNLDANCQALLEEGNVSTPIDWRDLFEKFFLSFNTTWRNHRAVTTDRITLEDNFFEYSKDYASLLNGARALTVYASEDEALQNNDAIDGALISLQAQLK